MKNSVSGRRGFTLLEILVALVLLAIVLSAIYSTFFLSQRAIEGVDESLLALQECRMTIDTISREMDSVVYTPLNKNSLFKLEDRDFFGKEASKVSFTSYSPLIPGLSLISYYAEEKDGVMTVYKTIRSVSEKEGEPEAVGLIDNAESFAVEVMYQDTWVKTWDVTETGKLPERVRITVKIPVKDRPVTLYETATPRIGRAL